MDNGFFIFKKIDEELVEPSIEAYFVNIWL